jgi:diguanylate cyclase (GGDEF)-like protein
VNREQKLEQVLLEFAHTLGTDFSVQEVVDHLVLRIVDVLSMTGAGVTAMSDTDDLHFVAGSNAVVLRTEALQSELNEGPCLEAFKTGRPVAVPDLNVDERFPRFSPRAFADGLAAMFTFPLRLDERRLGALNVYRDNAGDLAPGDLRAALVLADVAAAYLFNALSRADARDTAELLRTRSLHDALTGLPNRILFKERLEHAAARAHRTHREAAVLFVDLDDFKSVNDQFGHHVGDQLLAAVATRLRQILRPGDTLARLSGDEFVILCEDLDDANQAEVVAKRVADTLAPPFDLSGYRLEMTASVGLAFSGSGEDIPGTLLRDADFAMYQAKESGGAHHQVIDHGARLALGRREDLKRDLRGALQREEFRLVYQPIIDLRDGAPPAVEALLRWHHPKRGCVMPDAIVPIAERTGLILPIGEWVLRQACLDHQHWQSVYGPQAVAHVAVNVSARQVMGPAFAGTVARVLAETGTDPAAICLEVTESVYFDDAARAVTVLEEVKGLGVGLSLDDFGKGFSSLSYLKRFPFDVIKIDRSFIADLGSDPATHAIVAAIIDLAHALDLAVVAEGIETQQQFTQVTDLGSDRAQGYYLSHPLPPADLDQRILEPIGSSPTRLPTARQSGEALTETPTTTP